MAVAGAAMVLAWAPLASAPASAQAIKALLTSEFPSLDPAEVGGGEQPMVLYHIFCRLYSFNDKMEPTPDLVASESISDDKRTWTLKLRANAKFHDGTRVDAAAVKFNIERVLAQAGSARTLFAPITEVKAIAPDTVALVTSKPYPALRNNLASPNAGLLSPTAAKELGNRIGVQPVSCGPYSFVSWTRGSNILVKRYEGFYGPKPPYAQINFQFVPDVTTRLFMMQRKEGDFALRFGAQEATELRAAKVKVNEINGRSILYQFNYKQPPLDDIRVRQAINYAVDKAAIIKTVLFGAGAPSRSIIASDTFGGKPVGFYKYDPDKAKALLKEAGVANAKLKLFATQNLYYNDGLVAQAIAGYLRAVGFDVEVGLNGDWASYVERIGKRDFSLYQLSWGSSTGDPDRIVQALFHSKRAGQTWNFGAFADKDIDRLIEAGATTVDTPKRLAIYGELQEKLFADAPWLFMYRTTGYMALGDKITTIHTLEGPEFPYFFDLPH
jgi:ABC-type transport system substrate-binding protein